jgi:hypothetical protein
LQYSLLWFLQVLHLQNSSIIIPVSHSLYRAHRQQKRSLPPSKAGTTLSWVLDLAQNRLIKVEFTQAAAATNTTPES